MWQTSHSLQTLKKWFFQVLIPLSKGSVGLTVAYGVETGTNAAEWLWVNYPPLTWSVSVINQMVLISDSSPLWLRNVHVIQFGTHCCLQNPTQRFSKPLGVHTRRWNARYGQNRPHWRPLWVHTQNMVLCADFQKNIFVIPAHETNETKLTQNNPVSINSKWLFYSLLIKSKHFTSCKWFSFLSKCLNCSIFIIFLKSKYQNKDGVKWDMLTQGTILFSKVKQRCITVKVYCIKIPQMLKKNVKFHILLSNNKRQIAAVLKWNEMAQSLFMKMQYSSATQCEGDHCYFVFPWGNTLKWPYNDEAFYPSFECWFLVISSSMGNLTETNSKGLSLK